MKKLKRRKLLELIKTIYQKTIEAALINDATKLKSSHYSYVKYLSHNSRKEIKKLKEEKTLLCSDIMIAQFEKPKELPDEQLEAIH